MYSISQCYAKKKNHPVKAGQSFPNVVEYLAQIGYYIYVGRVIVLKSYILIMEVIIIKTFKRLVVLLLSAAMILAFTACGSSSEEPEPEEQAETEAETTAASEDAVESDASDVFNFADVGFTYELPEDLHIEKGSISKADFGELSYGSGVMMGYPIYYNKTDEEIRSLPDGEADSLKEFGTFVIICVKDAESVEEAKEKYMEAMTDFSGGQLTQEQRDLFSAVKEIHRENGYIWFMAYRDKIQVSDACQAEYEALFDATDDIIANHMKFFAPEEWEGFDDDAVLSFETVDLDGNTVKSEDLFAQNKVTMINLWGTYCGPCIAEMPEIEKMYQEFSSKGGGVVGIVVNVPVDNSRFLEDAQSLVQETGVTYPNLRVWEGYDKLLEHQGTPTTYFVDSKGKLIGSPILGAQVTTYPKAMEDLLSKAE